MVELARSGRTPEELCREFGPTAQSIRNWVAQADRDEGRRTDGLTTAERQELVRLRRENRQLKMERDILSKATAWFARETNKIPGKDGSS
jgi:transposase